MAFTRKPRTTKKDRAFMGDTKYMGGDGVSSTSYAPIGKHDSNYPKEHPYNDAVNHDKLLKHVIERMQLARETRDQFAIRLRTVDLDINGFTKLNDDDKQRMRDNRKGKSPKPVAVNLGLAFAKMDELQTFLLEVFWPNAGMHQAYSTEEHQETANGFALLLNKQADKRQHYRKFGRFLWDALKYNMAAIEIYWTKEAGFKLKNDDVMRLRKEETTFEGNDLDTVDMYNFFWDPGVHPVEIPEKAEYCATVKLFSKFAIKKQAAGGTLHGIDRFINQINDYAVTYYLEKPIVRFDYNSYTGSVDWMRFASGGKYQTIGTGIEIICMYLWLNPSEFGLSKDDEYQIWRVKLANHQYVVDVEYLNNAHNMLPVMTTVPYEDGLGLQTKSPAEQLMDYQRFASFLMNVHQMASRKSLYGKTIYDPQIINLGDFADDDVGGNFPVNPAGYGKDLTKAIYNMVDVPKTEKTLEDIKTLMDFMEQVMPTNIIKQVTDLDRATTYQAAATVQGANRRSYKLAKMINDQAVKKLRFQMMYNVLQYATSVDVIDQNGKSVTVDPSKLREIDIEFSVGEGLESIDKLMTISLLHDVINTIVQNQQASQELDMVKLLNYWTTLIGDKTDLNQFRRTQPSPSQQVDQQGADAQTTASQAATVAALAKAHQATAPQTPANGQAQ